MKEKTPQDKGRSFEKEFAKAHSMREQPASGATPYYKLDVKNNKFLLSLKHTDKQSYILKKSDIQETINAVYGLGGIGGSHIPAMCLSIDGIEVTVLLTEDFIEILENPDDTVFDKAKAKAKKDRADKPLLLRD